MRIGKTYIVVAVLLVALVGMMGFAIGCGSSSSSGGGSSASASPSGGAISGSAIDRATAILGHAPTGLALDIVTKGEVIVANDSNYAPQSSVDPVTKEVVGFDVDVAKGMAEILGLGIKWEHPAWETIPGGLNNGRYDVSIGSMTSAIGGVPVADRWKTLDFSEPYYYTTGQVFVKKGGTQVTSAADLSGKKVGVGAQTTYYDFLKGQGPWEGKNTGAIVKTYTTDADAFPDLLNGNTDFVMTAGTTGQQAILEGKPMEFSGKPFYYEDLSMAVKKGEADWVALLTYTVQQMHANGALSAMSKQWYNGLDLTVKQ
jgi:polar amino acid transport system substrate-binding protein